MFEAELRALLERATPEPWFAKENDLIGGFAVMNCDLPPSQADPSKGQGDVGDFMPSRSDAQLVAFQRNTASKVLAVVEAAREVDAEFRKPAANVTLLGELVVALGAALEALDTKEETRNAWAHESSRREGVGDMDAERIAEILSEHAEGAAWAGPPSKEYKVCHECGDRWPCETFELATLAAEAERYRTALEELKATVQSVCEAGHVDFPGLEILREALGESDDPEAAAALETGAQR